MQTDKETKATCSDYFNLPATQFQSGVEQTVDIFSLSICRMPRAGWQIH